jgi:hypothetical protein
MLEPTVAMYGCQMWSMTDMITLSKFLGEKHFQEGLWTSSMKLVSLVSMGQ